MYGTKYQFQPKYNKEKLKRHFTFYQVTAEDEFRLSRRILRRSLDHRTGLQTILICKLLLN